MKRRLRVVLGGAVLLGTCLVAEAPLAEASSTGCTVTGTVSTGDEIGCTFACAFGKVLVVQATNASGDGGQVNGVVGCGGMSASCRTLTTCEARSTGTTTMNEDPSGRPSPLDRDCRGINDSVGTRTITVTCGQTDPPPPGLFDYLGFSFSGIVHLNPGLCYPGLCNTGINNFAFTSSTCAGHVTTNVDTPVEYVDFCVVSATGILGPRLGFGPWCGWFSGQVTGTVHFPVEGKTYFFNGLIDVGPVPGSNTIVVFARRGPLTGTGAGFVQTMPMPQPLGGPGCHALVNQLLLSGSAAFALGPN